MDVVGQTTHVNRTMLHLVCKRSANEATIDVLCSSREGRCTRDWKQTRQMQHTHGGWASTALFDNDVLVLVLVLEIPPSGANGGVAGCSHGASEARPTIPVLVWSLLCRWSSSPLSCVPTTVAPGRSRRGSMGYLGFTRDLLELLCHKANFDVNRTQPVYRGWTWSCMDWARFGGRVQQTDEQGLGETVDLVLWTIVRTLCKCII